MVEINHGSNRVWEKKPWQIDTKEQLGINESIKIRLFPLAIMRDRMVFGNKPLYNKNYLYKLHRKFTAKKNPTDFETRP